MKDWGGGRGAGQNIIPSLEVLQRLLEKCFQKSMESSLERVPIPNVSVVDLTCRLEKSASYEDVKAAIKYASEGPLHVILGHTGNNVVSSDFVGDSRSLSLY